MTNFSHAEFGDLVRRLRASGCPLLPDEEIEDAAAGGLVIRQQGDFSGNRLFDLPPGGTGCSIDVELVSRSPLVLSYWELRLPWDDPNFYLLPDPGIGCYCFARGLEYPRALVINHRIYEEGRLRRGAFMRGLLLGRGSRTIPEEYAGRSVSVDISVYDILGNEYSSKVELAAQRSLRKTPRRLKPGRGLFEPLPPSSRIRNATPSMMVQQSERLSPELPAQVDGSEPGSPASAAPGSEAADVGNLALSHALALQAGELSAP